MTRPISGQIRPSRIEVPTSITTEGNSMMISVSLSMSTPHMPRVTLRTVEPAKVLACQSVEKRCTRWKALCAISAMILRVNLISTMKPNWRITTEPRPSAISIANAVSAAASASPPVPPLTAVTRFPA